MTAEQMEKSFREIRDRFAYRNGLFVLTNGGGGILTMLNDERFQPIDFSIMKA